MALFQRTKSNRGSSLVVRPAAPSDHPALARLAARAGATPLGGEQIVLASDGACTLAALDRADDRAIVDPRADAARDLVGLLRDYGAAGIAAPRRARRVRVQHLRNELLGGRGRMYGYW